MKILKSVLLFLHNTRGNQSQERGRGQYDANSPDSKWDPSRIQSDIYWTPSQISYLESQGHNVEGLINQVSHNCQIT